MTDSIQSNLVIITQIVYNSNYEIFLNDFPEDDELIKNGYQYFNGPEDDFKGLVKFSNSADSEVDIISYDLYYNIRIDRLFNEIQEEILVLSYEKGKNFKDLLDSLFNELRSIYNKAIDSGKDKYIAKQILLFRDFAKNKFSGTIENHIFYRIGIQKTDLSRGYFFPKENLKIPFLSDLYYLLIDHQVLDSEITSRDSFIDVLTSPMPSKSIQFTCNNYLIIYILDQLDSWFYKFTTARIGSSNCFKNKNGNILEAGDLNTARSRGKEASLLQKKHIKADLMELSLQFNL